MMNNGLVRKLVDEHQKKLGEEREWWNRRKARIQEGFMKELDAEGSGPAATGSAGAAAKGENWTPTPNPNPNPTPAPQVSDDDAVMVEAVDPAAGSNVAGGGGKKKKKGKK